MKSRIPVGLALMMSAHAAQASPGWSEGSWTKTQGIALLALWILNFVFVPVFLTDPRFHYLILPWMQILMQVAVVGLTMWATSRKRLPIWKRVVRTVAHYAIITLATNIVGGILADKYPSVFIGN